MTVRQVEENETIACKCCNSLEVVKYGTKNGKQNYYCKSCKAEVRKQRGLPEAEV